MREDGFPPKMYPAEMCQSCQFYDKERFGYEGSLSSGWCRRAYPDTLSAAQIEEIRPHYIRAIEHFGGRSVVVNVIMSVVRDTAPKVLKLNYFNNCSDYLYRPWLTRIHRSFGFMPISVYSLLAFIVSLFGSQLSAILCIPILPMLAVVVHQLDDCIPVVPPRHDASNAVYPYL